MIMAEMGPPECPWEDPGADKCSNAFTEEYDCSWQGFMPVAESFGCKPEYIACGIEKCGCPPFGVGVDEVAEMCGAHGGSGGGGDMDIGTFESNDKNGDGKITEKEACSDVDDKRICMEIFKAGDFNQDGKVTPPEFEALEYAVAGEPIPVGLFFEMFDKNRDGEIDLGEACGWRERNEKRQCQSDVKEG